MRLLCDHPETNEGGRGNVLWQLDDGTYAEILFDEAGGHFECELWRGTEVTGWDFGVAKGGRMTVDVEHATHDAFCLGGDGEAILERFRRDPYEVLMLEVL